MSIYKDYKQLFTLKFIFLSVLLNFVFIISCKKEKSCEGCNKNNKPPIAVAGPDQLIALPTDSVLLDGSSSSDPDGSISNFQWTKIAGPVSFNIRTSNIATSQVTSLTQGVYLFVLKVTDNAGLTDTDTIKITVNSPSQRNRPPVADAGADQTLILPNSSTIINGNNSTDPDNNIVNFLWTKISGPASYRISNMNAAQTELTNLQQGVYEFELTVTDAEGLLDKDTMRINLSGNSCFTGTRPIVNANLIQIGTLSQARGGSAAGFAGNKVVFAGGYYSGGESGAVDIYDLSTNQWTSSSLSAPRSAIAATTSGNKIFFGGGGYVYSEDFSKNVDVYDAASNSWSTIYLSGARTHVSAASVGNKVMFSGGLYFDGIGSDATDTVDVYNTTTNSWSLESLSSKTSGQNSIAVNDKIYFGLGSRVAIYNNTTFSWSGWNNTQMITPVTVSSVGNKIYWSNQCKVEIMDITTGSSTIALLTNPNVYKSVVKNGKIIFFHSGSFQNNSFDIYDPVTNTWSVGLLSSGYYPVGAAIISVNNEIYIAGGSIDCIPLSNGCMPLHTNKIYKLEF